MICPFWRDLRLPMTHEVQDAGSGLRVLVMDLLERLSKNRRTALHCYVLALQR